MPKSKAASRDVAQRPDVVFGGEWGLINNWGQALATWTIFVWWRSKGWPHHSFTILCSFANKFDRLFDDILRASFVCLHDVHFVFRVWSDLNRNPLSRS